MDPALRYRLATRLARRLRAEGRPLPLPALGEALGLRGPVVPVLAPLLDGRFIPGKEVGLWEWRYPFPHPEEAVVVLDLETTGLAPGLNEILEVALVRLEGGRRVAFQSLVRPRRPPEPLHPAPHGHPSRGAGGGPAAWGGFGARLPPPPGGHAGDPERLL